LIFLLLTQLKLTVGLGGASESFFACLRQVLVYHSFFSVGGTTLKVFQARIITLLEPEEAGRFPREPRELLSVFSLTAPGAGR
jgi:hypothetical protein